MNFLDSGVRRNDEVVLNHSFLKLVPLGPHPFPAPAGRGVLKSVFRSRGEGDLFKPFSLREKGGDEGCVGAPGAPTAYDFPNKRGWVERNMAERITLQSGDALIAVDVQNDFLPGGSLAVPKGDEVVPPLNRYLAAFHAAGLPIFATRDWHPANHCSFKAQGGPWPPHCVAETDGARFSADLELPAGTTIISKATTPAKDAYSGFEGTDLEARLRAQGVRRLFIGGLATDYCVLNTVRDARKNGFEVYLLTDAIRAVNVKPDDGRRAEDEMRRLGARPLQREMLAA